MVAGKRRYSKEEFARREDALVDTKVRLHLTAEGAGTAAGSQADTPRFPPSEVVANLHIIRLEPMAAEPQD